MLTLAVVSVLALTGCAQQAMQERKSTFYPPPPALPRIQYLHTLVTESDIGMEQSQFDQFLLGPEIDFVGVIRPYDVSSGPGKIYLIDRKYNRTFFFDLNERTLPVLEDTSHPDGVIAYAGGIWVDGDGSVYVADIKRRQILLFDADHNYIGAYGDDTVFEKPLDIAVFGDRMYVCDFKKSTVLVLDKQSGKVIGQLAEPGVEDEKLNRPTHVTVDANGVVYVTDAFNFKVKLFDADGKYIRSLGGAGDSLGQFARPKGVAVDREGRVHVVDAAAEHVQIFNSTGQLLLFFGGAGTAIENMWLPAGISIDYDNVDFFRNFADKDFQLEYLIYVANMAGPGRTNVYGYGKWTGEERRLDRMGEQAAADTPQAAEQVEQ